MKFLTQLLLLLSSCCLLFNFSSCTPDEPLNVNLGLDYYPLEIGKYRIYKVDSIIYDQDGGGTITMSNSIYVKEELTDTLRDNLGNLMYTLERFEKSNLNDEWKIKDVYGVSLIDYQLHTFEENLRFIKLKFPVGVHIKPWNGNSFIDEYMKIEVAGEPIQIFKGWLYEYTEVDEYMQIGNQRFDSTLTVLEANEDNKIEYRYSAATYARGVGLIKKEMSILNTQRDTCLHKLWVDKAQEGFILNQEIIEYN